MSKPKRENLCLPVRLALSEEGYSYFKVLSAVNAALGELELETSDSKTAKRGRVMKKTGVFVIGTSQKEKWTGPDNICLHFDRWNSAVKEACDIASFDTVSIPPVFKTWLEKMKEPRPEYAQQSEQSGQSEQTQEQEQPA